MATCGTYTDTRRLRRHSLERPESPLTDAVRRLKARMTWAQVGDTLGIPSGTVRLWLYEPPIRTGRSVRKAREALSGMGESW